MATLAGGASLDDLWGVVRLTSCHTLEGSHGMQRETWSLRNTLPRILNGVAFAEGLRAELHCYRLKHTARLRRTAGLVWVYSREALAQRGSCCNDQ